MPNTLNSWNGQCQMLWTITMHVKKMPLRLMNKPYKCFLNARNACKGNKRYLFLLAFMGTGKNAWKGSSGHWSFGLFFNENVNLVNKSFWEGPKNHWPLASQVGPCFQLNMVVVYLRAEVVYKTILHVSTLILSIALAILQDLYYLINVIGNGVCFLCVSLHLVLLILVLEWPSHSVWLQIFAEDYGGGLTNSLLQSSK